MEDYQADIESTPHQDIRAIFETFKETRLKLYDDILKNIDDFDDWSIPAERLLAYYIVVRNLRKYGDSLRDKVRAEIMRIHNGEVFPN